MILGTEPSHGQRVLTRGLRTHRTQMFPPRPQRPLRLRIRETSFVERETQWIISSALSVFSVVEDPWPVTRDPWPVARGIVASLRSSQ